MLNPPERKPKREENTNTKSRKLLPKPVRALHVFYSHIHFGGNNMSIHSFEPTTGTSLNWYVVETILTLKRTATVAEKTMDLRRQTHGACRLLTVRALPPLTLKGAGPLRCRRRVRFGASRFRSCICTLIRGAADVQVDQRKPKRREPRPLAQSYKSFLGYP